MKKRRVLMVVLLISVVYLFSGCITLRDRFAPLQDVQQIQQISLYDLPGKSIYYAAYYADESIFPEPLAYIDKNDYEAFIEDLTDLSYKQIVPLFPVAFDPNHNFYGYVVRIDYQDGARDVISFALRTSQSAAGNVEYTTGSCTEKKFNGIVEKYIIAINSNINLKRAYHVCVEIKHGHHVRIE